MTINEPWRKFARGLEATQRDYDRRCAAAQERVARQVAENRQQRADVLNVLLKTAVAWGVIERVPCAIKLLRVSKSAASFYDFGDYEQLVEAARADGPTAYLVALLGGEAGLRCGEIMVSNGPT